MAKTQIAPFERGEPGADSLQNMLLLLRKLIGISFTIYVYREGIIQFTAQKSINTE